MTEAYLPPVEFLRECFSYDRDTGLLVWKNRPETHFSSRQARNAWNGRYAGTCAFTETAHSGHLRGCITYRGGSRKYFAHRVAYALVHGECPEQIDHANGNPSDNRIANLRAASRCDNARNWGGSNGRTLPKGVTFVPLGRRKFAAHARGPSGKAVYIGVYSTPSEAHDAYCSFVRPFHGEFFNPGPRVESVFD